MTKATARAARAAHPGGFAEESEHGEEDENGKDGEGGGEGEGSWRRVIILLPHGLLGSSTRGSREGMAGL